MLTWRTAFRPYAKLLVTPNSRHARRDMIPVWGNDNDTIERLLTPLGCLLNFRIATSGHHFADV
ncbi:hypothetical protein LMG28727_06264 [Paraburkholderia kirstenboschensis]|nr:hypothetical protein LMG28727_06264 [Paraburkholderia kirstenboschensis]